MYAYEITTKALADVAASLKDITVDADWQPDHNRVKFTLKPIGNGYISLSPNPVNLKYVGDTPVVLDGWKWRKGQGVCYHGHYIFLRKLFDMCPLARVESSWYGRVVYTADNFEERAAEMGNTRLGKEDNIYYPLRLRNKCNCETVKRPDLVPTAVVEDQDVNVFPMY